MKFKELFKGIKFGKMQNAANMIVIPILRESEFTNVSSDMLFHITNDSDYSHLTLSNTDSKPVIVPQGTSYINKQDAQDRAILSTEIINGGHNKIVNVGCVQSSQCGHMSSGTAEIRFIPKTIRGKAIQKNNTQGHRYGILWGDIEAYKKDLNMSGPQHIQDVYSYFDAELEEFVAPFENEDNQVGAVILINGQVAGIELYPNYGSWRKVWRKLIRDTYAMEAIKVAKQGSYIGVKPLINLDEINSVTDLEIQINQVISKNLDFVMGKTNDLLSNDTTLSEVSSVGDLSVKNINLHGMIGQIVMCDDNVIYLTALSTT